MFIIKAVNIYPGQIDSVLSTVDGIGSEYQVVLERIDGKDNMIVRVERGLGVEPAADTGLADLIKKRLRNKILVTPDVHMVDCSSLPRSERKTKRVFDNRER
jgi:phenylacetate-CoA ligase